MFISAFRSLVQNRDTRWMVRQLARGPHKLSKLRNIARVQWAKLRKDPSAGRGMPLIVSVEPTNACNMKCPMCPTGLDALTRKKGMMDFTGFSRLLDQIERTTLIMTFWGIGESTLHPRLYEMIGMARRRGILTMLTMNGTNFDPVAMLDSGLDYLVVSFDGTREESYAPVRRGGQLQHAIDGVRAIVAERKRRGVTYPKINMGFIVTRLNQDELPQLEAFAHEIGFDSVRPKYLHTITRQVAEELRPSRPELVGNLGQEGPGRMLEQDIPGITPLLAPNGCGLLWEYAMIFQDGTMAPCCYDWDATAQLGNAFHDDFRSLWHGEAYTEFRRRVTHDKQSMELCKNCEGGDISVFFSDTFLLNK
ncbi:MAG: SPASM domain-containing protein [Planctomycetes bacterium]|nr:SPASM domain-containing protein [Planctomycetota bacterium]